MRARHALAPFLRGGPQERGRRGGTENVAGIVGLGVACELAARELGARAARVRRACATGSGAGSRRRSRACARNGDAGATCCRTRSRVEFAGADGEVLLQALDLEGVAVSAGAACSSGSIEPSHVLLAMGRTPAEARAHAALLARARRRRGADRRACSRCLPDLVARARAREARRERGAARSRASSSAMSGGVDSSVAAALLVEQGYEVIGVTLHLAGAGIRCCSLDDADDARRVAERLGIRFYVANYARARSGAR